MRSWHAGVSLVLLSAAVALPAADPAVAPAPGPAPRAPAKAKVKAKEPAPAAIAANLVPNGTFEAGKAGVPDTWQRPDGLTSFWVKDALRKGMCLKIDSDVYKQEYRARQDELEKNPAAPAKPKTPTSGAKYDTVAGVEGVSYYSDWIAVTPDQWYRFDINVRTEGEKKTPKIFLKGYFLDPKRPEPYQRRVKYKKFLDCPGEEKWQTFSMTFCPTARDKDIQWVRVMLYAFWPPGIYYFDNVKLVPVPPPDASKTAPAPPPPDEEPKPR